MIIEVGLTKRHETPAIEYIWDIEIPIDVEKIQKHTQDKMLLFYNEYLAKCFVINNEIEGFRLYVSGLTIAVLAVVKVCIKFNVNLEIVHYNKNTKKWDIIQEIINNNNEV